MLLLCPTSPPHPPHTSPKKQNTSPPPHPPSPTSHSHLQLPARIFRAQLPQSQATWASSPGQLVVGQRPPPREELRGAHGTRLGWRKGGSQRRPKPWLRPSQIQLGCCKKKNSAKSVPPFLGLIRRTQLEFNQKVKVLRSNPIAVEKKGTPRNGKETSGRTRECNLTHLTLDKSNSMPPNCSLMLDRSNIPHAKPVTRCRAGPAVGPRSCERQVFKIQNVTQPAMALSAPMERYC